MLFCDAMVQNQGFECVTVYGDAVLGQTFSKPGVTFPQGVTENVLANSWNGANECLKRFSRDSIEPARVIPEARERAFVEAARNATSDIVNPVLSTTRASGIGLTVMLFSQSVSTR